MQSERFPNHKTTETGENLSRGVRFSAACWINQEHLLNE